MADAEGLRWRSPEFDQSVLAIADFVELKSPCTLRPARGVGTGGMLRGRGSA